MARSTFGATSVDWLLRPYPFGSTTLVALRTGTTFLTFWDQPTGGTRYMDLLDGFGTPITQVTVVGHQIPLFQGPDAVLAMWADKGDGSPRERIEAQDLAAAASAVAAAEAARDQAVATVVDTVKVTAQTLLTAQQDQARANIAAIGSDGLAFREPRLFRLGQYVAPSIASDQTAAVQAFLDSLVDGDEVRVDKGTWRIDGTLTIAQNDLTVRIRQSARLSRVAGSGSVDGILVTGSGVNIIGHGVIESPASFNGANVQPTYAVVRVTGSGGRVRDLTLENVPKVGVYFDNTDKIDVRGLKIKGNYPAGSFTGTETGHFGVAFNPGLSIEGCGKIVNNEITGCVQGIFVGNYGTPVTAYGLVIDCNDISLCHNHGIYNAGGVDACVVSGNAFSRCQGAIALTGVGHVVVGNSIYTASTGSGVDVAGISMREAISCSVVGNVVKGDAPTAAAIIDLGNYTAGFTEISRNVVAGNTVHVIGGSSVLIRVGRSSTTTTCHDNVVADNTVRGVGNTGVGLISLNPAAGASSYGNKIAGNSVVVKGVAHGINASNTSHATIVNNGVRFEVDAGSSVTLGALVLVGSTYCTISGNDVHCPATWGTNVILRGVWEQTGSDNNRIIQNGYHGDLTKLTSFTPIVLVTSSNSYLDERGIGSPTGAFYGAPGSRWSRVDGGAATSMYIKESANTSATWVAK